MTIWKQVNRETDAHGRRLSAIVLRLLTIIWKPALITCNYISTPEGHYNNKHSLCREINYYENPDYRSWNHERMADLGMEYSITKYMPTYHGLYSGLQPSEEDLLQLLIMWID